MRLRRRRVLAGLVGLLLALPLLLWGGYAGLALLRHEHFYHGLPSSHWSWAVRRASMRPWPVSWPWTALDSVLGYLGFGSMPAVSVTIADPAAASVLIDLLRDDEEQVRLEAAGVLGEIGSPARIAVPALLNAASGDGSREVRSTAAGALARIRPPSEEVVPTILRLTRRGEPEGWFTALATFGLWIGSPEGPAILAEAMRHSDPEVRYSAVRHLWAWIDPGRPESACMVPLLREAVRDKDKRVEHYAAEALWAIDPEGARKRGVRQPLPTED